MVAPPPRQLAVPSSPVSSVPSANYDLFGYGSRYNGTWFFAANSGVVWTVVATDRIPQPALAVRHPRDDYTTAALRQKEALAKQ